MLQEECPSIQIQASKTSGPHAHQPKKFSPLRSIRISKNDLGASNSVSSLAGAVPETVISLLEAPGPRKLLRSSDLWPLVAVQEFTFVLQVATLDIWGQKTET